MNNLDTKLIAIFADWADKEIELDNVIAQIKQAFADEGYLKPSEAYRFVHSGGKLPVMTGQEWYDRFRNELAKPKIKSYDQLAEAIATAAKKAAGIK